ncbi:MAG: undecaprenyl/decaprenyl-phosphate alpha-N-acetylglucosaminyl 1-phosphate transferase [Anaerolineae bacterium]|jgi:UDP-GlcNAc:undecaprenyl-phosphate GlcNAc-1-phosphate transferase|nr:undecaprenyl/decaprenyl-phosphate alpha-N-acetylglucosaminyl 1-phosphate transferase [Anaerolineae bacterium]
MDTTLQYIPIMIVGFATALGLTPVSRQIAMRLGVVDKPTLARKIHTDHKPMMGGLAIYVGFTLSLLLFSPPRHIIELLAIIAGAGVLSLVGLLDDRFNLSWRVRLLTFFSAAAILILAGIRIRLFDVPLLDIPLTLIWVVALTNATNFLDNMDGLTAGLSAIASGFFLLIAITQGQVLVSMLAAAVFGSAVGFLTYNFNPASTFMGDMGALVLGFVLATLAIKLHFAAQPPGVTWMIPVLVLALPVFDINLVVWTRLAEGRSPVEGGKDHTSHRIMSLGFNQRQTLFLLYGLCGLFGSIGFIVSAAPPDIALRVGLFGLALLLALFLLMIWIRQTYQKSAAGGRR